MILAMFITAMNACAQDQLEDKMNALRSRGFGARNTEAIQVDSDSIKAAFNIITGMPRWKPGYTNGEPADKSAQVTVSFGKQN